ncbi:Uncharacterised protein [uncultured archaeon]|nr:Uncharacterised protein [uncultured archaeon]
MGGVIVELELPRQNLTSHRHINRFMEFFAGKLVLLRIEEAI